MFEGGEIIEGIEMDDEQSHLIMIETDSFHEGRDVGITAIDFRIHIEQFAANFGEDIVVTADNDSLEGIHGSLTCAIEKGVPGGGDRFPNPGGRLFRC